MLHDSYSFPVTACLCIKLLVCLQRLGCRVASRGVAIGLDSLRCALARRSCTETHHPCGTRMSPSIFERPWREAKQCVYNLVPGACEVVSGHEHDMDTCRGRSRIA
mgnify:CR=1 FL=1